MSLQNVIQVTTTVELDAARALDRLVAQRQAEAGPARRITRASVVREALDRLLAEAPADPCRPDVRVRRRPYCTTRADKPGCKTA